MPKRLRVAALAASATAAALLVLGATRPLAQSVERFTLTGDEVVVYNLAGELEVVPSDGHAVIAEVERAGRDGGDLRIVTGPIGTRQTLRVIYPGHRIVYPGMGRGSSTRLAVGDDGVFGESHEGGWRATGRTTVVAGSGTGIEGHANLKLRVPAGQRLVIHWVAGRATVTNVDGDLRIDHSTGPLTADGTRGRLSLDTGSGRVEVSRARGDIALDTGSGAVIVNDVQGGRLALDTGSGAVSIANVQVDELDADTGSGSVDVQGAQADDIRLDTGSGRVELDLVDDVSSLVIDTGSGGILVRVPRSLGADFQIETSSGGIDVDVPHEVQHMERHELRGRFGDGKGTIRIDSGSGGVRILGRGTTGARPARRGPLFAGSALSDATL